MLKYKLYQDNREGSKTEGKWFARVAVSETVDLDGLARHMADHHSPYSEGLITGILKDMALLGRELRVEEPRALTVRFVGEAEEWSG